MEPYLGEIKMFSYNWAPNGWLACNGNILPVQQNQALFSLLGAKFGGDGRTNFAVPDLRGRTPVAQGSLNGVTIAIGNTGGASAVSLNTNQIPAHNHQLYATTALATQKITAGNYLATARVGTGTTTVPDYAPIDTQTPSNNVVLNASSISTTGGQPHNNMQPSLGVNFCIATSGIYPQRN